MKLIDITNYSCFSKSSVVEDIICLSVLISHDKLKTNSTTDDADAYLNSIVDCDNCEYHNRCLSYIINK